MKAHIRALLLTVPILGSAGPAVAVEAKCTIDGYCVLQQLCSLVDVASFDNRIHLHCRDEWTERPGTHETIHYGVYYYATEASSPMAQSAVQVGLTALAQNKLVWIAFDEFAEHNPKGCLKDCRRLLGVAVVK